MSVGRQVCIGLIDKAEQMRRYAALVAEFETHERGSLDLDLVSIAERMEALVPLILEFEGEQPRLLTMGASS